MNNSRFQETIITSQHGPLRAATVSTLQVNIGYRCNLLCRHCHIGAGPSRSEMMDRSTIDEILGVLADTDIPALDITGGAPELNPHFRYLITEARRLGKHVITRTNLAIFSEEGMADLPEFYSGCNVELIASLPCYLEKNVDGIRGSGTFSRSIRAVRTLNGLGYGLPDGLPLSLVYNPGGAFLPPEQGKLEQDYKRELAARYGISFTRLYTITNMPLGRFRDALSRTGDLNGYLHMLFCAFNPATLNDLMCRHLVSVGPDGRLFDCDFNQVLGMTVSSAVPAHIHDFDRASLAHRIIRTGDHCFGCTAGTGSSCTGATALQAVAADDHYSSVIPGNP